MSPYRLPAPPPPEPPDPPQPKPGLWKELVPSWPWFVWYFIVLPYCIGWHLMMFLGYIDR